MASKGEPMTEQELAAVLDDDRVAGSLAFAGKHSPEVHRRKLLAEVDRLKAERDAAVRERDEARAEALRLRNHCLRLAGPGAAEYLAQLLGPEPNVRGGEL